METIRIQDKNGYHTQQVRGQKASSTSSADTAAERLAKKLYGDTGKVYAVRWIGTGKYEADIGKSGDHVMKSTERTAMQFITVPETTLPNGVVVPSFQLGQFVCSKGDDGKLAVTPDGKPWVNINYHAASQACEDAGVKLLTETQWLAMAHNAAAQDCNWTKGKVGEGQLFRGLHKGNVGAAQPGNHEPTNPKERRWLTLSNGERVCDLNGNVYQWIFDDVQGDENGLVAKAFAADSPSLQAPYPPLKKGMGWRPEAGANWSGGALLRGGYWYSGSYAGAFCLDGGWPDYENYYVGFRCTK